MRRWEEAKKPKARIEIIPMIDVMMFLLVFFVLLSLNVIPALGVKTNLPSASTAHDLQVNTNAVITIPVTGDVQLEGKSVSIDALPQVLKDKQQPNVKLSIVLNADKGVDFQKVLDVLDALKGHGFDAISFATKRK
ncbi:MAG: biopolymer transporter ExbD [Burkholderiales bacterium]|nr:biopolymer transporter ExbD [Burkholderiales bacterium]